MKEDCFAYSKNYENRCSVLKVSGCTNCNFYKSLDTYKEDLKKLTNYNVRKKVYRKIYLD